MRRFVVTVAILGLMLPTIASHAQGRKPPPPLPEPAKKVLDWKVGTWDVHAKEYDVKGRIVYKWSPGEYNLIGQAIGLPKNLIVNYTKVWAWDAQSDDGLTVQLITRGLNRYETHRIVSDTVIEGEAHGVYQGKKAAGKVREVREGEDKYTLYLTEQTRDGESQPDETLVFTRIKSTTREDFEEFCKLAEGRWTTEITLDEDVPGFGKKGETIVGHMNHALTTNGSAMIGRHNFGEGWVTELKTYDPQSKEIITTQAMSDGTIGHIREHKSHGEWAVKNTEIMPDGTKSESIGTTVFSGDGETWTIKFGSIGQEEDEWSMSVWRRISK